MLRPLSTDLGRGVGPTPVVGDCCVVKKRIPWAPPRTPFTIAHVAHLGVTARRLDSAHRCGQITRLRQGVYIASESMPDDPVDLHLLRALAEQVATPGLVASRETAAMAHGLPLHRTHRSAADAVHLTRADGAAVRSQRRTGRAIHVARLPEHHVVTLPSGLVVTARPRTAVDLASQWSLPEGLMVLDAAARAEFVELAGSPDPRHYDNARLRRAARVPLAEAVGAVAGRGSARRLSAVLDLVDVRRESPLESFSGGHFHLAGLPEPVPQARVRAAGRSYRVDFLWKEYGLVGEGDGEGKYTGSGAYVDEKVREQHLVDAGFVVVRWVGREAFARPSAVVDRVARALAARGWPGS